MISSLSRQSPPPARLARRLTLLAACAFAISATGAWAASKAAPELGVWLDHTAQGAVEIAPCGNRLCGHIVWLKQPNTPEGKPLVDVYNPIPGKRKRPICGLPVVGNLQKQAGGSWDAGWVYDPKDGKSYDFAVQYEGKDRLTVTGYMGSKFFGKSMTWTRAPASLRRCAATARAETAAKDAAPQPGPKADARAVEPANAEPARGRPEISDQSSHGRAAPSSETPRLSTQAAAGGLAAAPAADERPAPLREAGDGGPSAPPAPLSRVETAASLEAAAVPSAEPVLIAGPVRARPKSARRPTGGDEQAPPGRAEADAVVNPPPR